MHIQENVELKNYSSLRAGGRAERLINTESHDDLAAIISEYRPQGPVWVLGDGTNCLISDKGLPGTVILNHTGDIQKLSSTKFKVGSGVSWDEFIKSLIAEDLWGLEFTSGIPGGVGAAVVGNIAAYGHKVADCFVEATILDAVDGSVETWDKAQLNFDYRSSALQLPENKDKIVLDATFELSQNPTSELEYASALKIAEELNLAPDTLVNRRQIIIETRRRADALFDKDNKHGPWTAGSFFRNPLVDQAQVDAIIAHEEQAGKTKEQILLQNQVHGQDKARVSAAHVLLAAGFARGQTWGQVRLDPEHILKVENMGSASAQEIYNVVQEIVRTVKDKLGIDLVPEVRFLGEF